MPCIEFLSPFRSLVDPCLSGDRSCTHCVCSWNLGLAICCAVEASILWKEERCQSIPRAVIEWSTRLAEKGVLLYLYHAKRCKKVFEGPCKDCSSQSIQQEILRFFWIREANVFYLGEKMMRWFTIKPSECDTQEWIRPTHHIDKWNCAQHDSGRGFFRTIYI